jgi:oligopeptidase B
VEYSIQHHRSGIFIKYKDTQNLNSKIYKAPLDKFRDLTTWKEVVKHDTAVKIQDMDVFDKYLTLYIRKNGLDGIVVIDLFSGEKKSIGFPEPVYPFLLSL